MIDALFKQRQLASLITLILGLSIIGMLSPRAHAYQAFVTPPGTRAVGMAGVFAAQADDVTAIWYNPSGLSRPGLMTKELSVELGEQLELDRDGNYISGDAAVKFIGAHTADLPDWRGIIRRPAVGLALLRPYRIDVDVTESRSVLDSTPFGRVVVDYTQASLLASTGIGENISIGVTYDLLWADVDCLVYSPCAADGPAGSGYSLAFTYLWPVNHRYQVNVALLARSKASMGYGRVATSGIGRYLEEYIPDRPVSYGAGLNIRSTTPWGVVSGNMDVEQVKWSETVGAGIAFDAQGMDYLRFGLGGEVMLPLGSETVALRGGYVSETPDDDGRFPEIDRLGVGFGLSVRQQHFVDVAVDWRNIKTASDEKRQPLFSVSYSWQR